MRLERYKAEHTELLRTTAVDDEIRDVEFSRLWAQVNERCGPGWTAFAGETILGCAGFRLHPAQTADAWLIFSVNAKPHTRQILRILRLAIPSMMKSYGIIKLRTHSRAGFDKSQRLLDSLGFERKRRFRNFYLYIRRAG